MSYREALERVRKTEKALGGVPTKPSKGAFVGFEGRGVGVNPKTFTWRDFYPDQSWGEWRIAENERGVSGTKVTGDMVGVVSFYIPSKRLAEGPLTATGSEQCERQALRLMGQQL